jgi:hypothetical protein
MSATTGQPYPYQRILRRETHSPRSVLAITVSVVIIVLCVYAGTEIVLGMLNHRALLVAPQDALTAVSGLGTAPTGVPITIGVLLMVLGLFLLVGALTPGRRARHQLPSRRAAVVVDDEVIASSLARQAAHAGNANPDNTVVSVSARRATVRIVPTSGTPVLRSAVADAVHQQLAEFELTPSVSASVEILPSGRVG